MDKDNRITKDDNDSDSSPLLYNPVQKTTHPPRDNIMSTLPSGYTLMVAGQRTGKTSFLRLLLDTSDIAPTATKDQLASVAKFVQGSSGHTSHIRTASIDIDLDIHGNGVTRRLALTLVDTPSLDFMDESSSGRLVSDMLRHVDSRYAEGVDDDWKAQNGDHHVHLCIYFLNPDYIVPPSVPGPPAPLVPRATTNSFSQPDPEPVILEPPVTTNPFLCRPTLPPTEINTIRRLSARVNVLPVVARADTLTNDRLAAVKVAIRRDLAEAGIGFGIFDVDTHYPLNPKDDHSAQPLNGDPYPSLPNGSSSVVNSPPVSPVTPSHLRLPYALTSPDIYSHSDGITRIPLSRHELVQQYSPSANNSSPKMVRGKFTRSYRWGSMDVLDPNHSDFLPLRAAIFHHMETLQKYTREYLFDKFRAEYHHLQQQSVPLHTMPHHIAKGMAIRAQLPPLSHASRPILAIDTAPPHAAANRHPSLSISRDMATGADIRPNAIARAGPDAVTTTISSKTTSSGPRSAKQRTKKITVACNFCRSRKLKCDGGRPACGQCVKRSNVCDYMPQNKRRGTLRQRKGDDSESESIEDRSGEADEALLSPDVPSQPPSRRSSNVERTNMDSFTPSLSGGPSERREDNQVQQPSQPPSSQLSAWSSKPSGGSGAHSAESRHLFPDNELPHIATLSLPASSPTPMSAPSLPPIRPASEQQAAQRKRAATVPGKSGRQSSNSGPKVVACNFCRARKTKCDGAHPACSSCARRSLPCNYVHDTGTNGAQKKGSRRASTSTSSTRVASVATGVRSTPQPIVITGVRVSHTKSSTPVAAAAPTVSSAPVENYRHREESVEMDIKREREETDSGRPVKKMKMENDPMTV